MKKIEKNLQVTTHNTKKMKKENSENVKNIAITEKYRVMRNCFINGTMHESGSEVMLKKKIAKSYLQNKLVKKMKKTL